MTTERSPLPETRFGKTHRIRIEDGSGDALDLYVRTGYYADGRLGEVFVNVAKQGSTLQGLVDSWFKLFSFALQYGVPLEEVGARFVGDSFAPQGTTSDGECTSLIDCVMQYLMSEAA